MIRPQSISAFLSDSLSINVAVFDASGAPFNLEANQIAQATLYFPESGISPSSAVSISANTCSFFIPSDTLLNAGTIPFYIQIENLENRVQYTVAHGYINVINPSLSSS